MLLFKIDSEIDIQIDLKKKAVNIFHYKSVTEKIKWKMINISSTCTTEHC